MKSCDKCDGVKSIRIDKMTATVDSPGIVSRCEMANVDAKFCPKCGRKLEDENGEASKIDQ